MMSRWLTGNLNRALLLSGIAILAIWNLLTFWLARSPVLPFEWIATPSGPMVYRVTDPALRDDLEPGDIWIEAERTLLVETGTTLESATAGMDTPSARAAALYGPKISAWLNSIERGETVELVFFRRGSAASGQSFRFIHVPWTVKADPVIPRLWVFLTGALLLGVAAWSNPRFQLSQFHRRMWVATVALSLVYLFSPVGRWHAIDWLFWLLDRLGFALAPVALVHWALSWSKEPRSRYWHWFRRAWPILWLTVHLALAAVAVTGLWSPWTPRFRTLFDLVLALDWALLATAGAVAIGSGLVAIPRRRGEEKRRLQIINGALMLAFIPALFATLPLLFQAASQPWMTLAVLTHPLLPLGIGIAVARYRWDVEHVFRRSLIYGLLIVALGLMYAGVFGLISWAFADDRMAQVFMMALFAIIPGLFFFPTIRDWAIRWIDRYYFGARSHPREELERMIWKDLNILPIESWLARLMNHLAPALDCSWANAALAIGADRPFWVLSAPLPALVDQLQTSASRDTDTSPPMGRPVRPGIIRYAHGSATVYCVECQSEPDLRLSIWLLWDYPDHWLGREDLDLLARLQKRVTLALQNFKLFNEVQQRAELMEHLQRFHHTVIHALDVGLLVTDADHQKILLANHALARWLQTTPEEMAQRPMDQFLPDIFIRNVRDYFDATQRRDDVQLPLLKAFLQGPDGRRRLLQVTRRSLKIPVGTQTVDGVLYLMEDITHQHHLEQQLIQAEKLSSIGLLAAGIAHEINTPLTGIASYTQMLLQRAQDDAHRRLLVRVQDQVEQMKQIVQTLLDMAQPQRQTERVVVLQDVIKRSLRLLNPHLKNAPVQVRLDLIPEPVPIFGNEAQLHQVLSNLILNARDAMPEGGEILIRLSRNGDWAVLEVRDTGVGMDTQTLSRIFDPFFTTKAGQGGTGLGLTITYHIIRQHGGRIEVESSPGLGTRFQVHLPILSKEKLRHGIRTALTGR